MTLDEWLISQDEDPQLMDFDDYELVKGAWNTALEEAAKHLDHLGQTHTLYSADFMAREIRYLKDE